MATRSHIVAHDVTLQINFNSTQRSNTWMLGHPKLKQRCFAFTPLSNSMPLEVRNNVVAILNAITKFLASLHQEEESETRCTFGWRSRIAKSTVASLSLTTSNGLVCGFGRTHRGNLSKPISSSRTMGKSEYPNSCDSNSSSESNRSIRARRLLQSSSNSHLQYISTRGRSCMHEVRST